ncbi:MAG: lysylphosphatidylglycerol synthase transmembrane domain-containing protein [Lacipirellulaceae bacterium]
MSDAAAKRRHRLIAAAKVLLAVGIMAFLLYRLQGEDVFNRLLNEPKDWQRLVLAQVAILTAFSISCVRWYFLVKALGIKFHMSDAFRLGSLGFLLSQVSLGSIGGDLFKALVIAKEQPDHQTHAVASVVIDRIVGLYAMILMASLGLVIAGGLGEGSEDLRMMAQIVAVAAVFGTVGLIALFVPATTSDSVRESVEKWPVVGDTVAQLVDAARLYRDQRRTVFLTILLGLCTHLLLATGLWSIGKGLPVSSPDFATMLLIGPISLFAGALPITPSGLGTFEATVESLLTMTGAAKGDGTLVALTYRVMTYVVAAVGAVYYLSAKKSIDATLQDVEEGLDAESGKLDPTDLASGELL